MKIGIPKETVQGESRVALVPSMVASLTKLDHEVLVESGAGERSSLSDEEYKEAGAKVIANASMLYSSADVVIKIQPPGSKGKNGDKEVDLISDGSVLISYLNPFDNADLIKKLAKKNVTSFSLEFIPRITRAQSMDTLSSMATVVGYKAVLMGANILGKFMPLLMTAAGTIQPSRVLVLGVGVAGLQAIATAKRLGGRVEAFDPRPAVREQVESLGAAFVEMDLPEEDAETKGGYAKVMSEEFLRLEQEAIAKRLPRVDMVVTTAAIFGKPAPMLITKEMVGLMPTGSVIIDIAAASGGNCELTKAGETVDVNGVTIVGNTNLAAELPYHASQMFSKNLVNLLTLFYPEAESELDFEDEIVSGSCITRTKVIVNEMVKGIVEGVK